VRERHCDRGAIGVERVGYARGSPPEEVYGGARILPRKFLKFISYKKYVLWNTGICPIASKVGHVTLATATLGSFIVPYVVLAADDLTKKTRKNVDRHRNYGPKSKYKMAAVRHLGFVTSSHRTTHKVFPLGHIGLSNFVLIRCIVLKI